MHETVFVGSPNAPTVSRTRRSSLVARSHGALLSLASRFLESGPQAGQLRRAVMSLLTPETRVE